MGDNSTPVVARRPDAIFVALVASTFSTILHAWMVRGGFNNWVFVTLLFGALWGIAGMAVGYAVRLKSGISIGLGTGVILGIVGYGFGTFLAEKFWLFGLFAWWSVHWFVLGILRAVLLTSAPGLSVGLGCVGGIVSLFPYTMVIIAWFASGPTKAYNNVSFLIWLWASFTIAYCILLAGIPREIATGSYTSQPESNSPPSA